MMPLSPAIGFDEIGDLLAAAGFCRHRQPQIGPIETMDEHGGLGGEQPIQNIGARCGIGGGGESHGLNTAKFRLHRTEPGISGRKS